MRLLILAMIIMNLILLPSLALSQDYPAGYLGPGHREYLNDKIRGGYHVEVFTDLENRQKERVNKRNQIETIVNSSYQANLNSAHGIFEASSQRERNSQEINWSVEQSQGRAEQNATNQTEFKYIKHTF